MLIEQEITFNIINRISNNICVVLCWRLKMSNSNSYFTHYNSSLPPLPSQHAIAIAIHINKTTKK